MSTVSKGDGSSMKIILFFLVVSVSLCAVFAVNYTLLRVRVAFADGEVAVFEEARTSSSGMTDAQKLSGKLEYVINYYPSGSKQRRGTQLDRMVEASRSNTIAAIINRLRATTGKDVGNDPQQWLKEFPAH